METKEQLETIKEAIKHITDTDKDVPLGVHFDQFHKENAVLILKLKKLAKSLR